MRKKTGKEQSTGIRRAGGTDRTMAQKKEIPEEIRPEKSFSGSTAAPLPAGDIGSLELSDIIDVAAIRAMMVDFSALANIPVAIIDLQGKVLVGEAWQDICTKFHRIHPDTCKHCVESDTQLTKGVRPGESRLYKCKNNMWDVATPIMVGGEHLGNVFSGQFFFNDEPVDYDLFRAQARLYGFNEEAYMNALAAVPRLSREFVDKAISFLLKLAQTLSQLSYSNIKLARSLTERDALMDSLRESEEKYRNLVKYAPAAIYEVNPQGTAFLSVNEAMCDILGYSSAELLAMKPADLLSPESRLLFQKRMQHTLAGEKIDETFEYRIRRKDGELIDAAVNVRAFSFINEKSSRILVIAYDITGRKKIEEALRISEERLKRAQEIAHLGSWELDLATNSLSWSDETYRIFGLQPQEFAANYEAFLERVYPADRDAVDAAYSGSLHNNLDQYEIEHRVVRKDTGKIRFVHERCQHIRDNSGVIIRSGGMVHDITDRKRDEDLLLKKTELLEAANRELESFTYTVSHDLRSPLRAIDGYSRMILKKHADKFDSDLLEKFNVIRKSTQTMGQLIEDLLAFSRLGRAQLSRTQLDMDILIREVWQETCGNETQRHIDFRIRELPPGLGDRGLIKQVLTNILANAVKFTRTRDDAVIETGGYTTNGENVYYVRDNGVGFDMSYHDKLFGVFSRLHHPDDFEGTGVGLAIVQRIIHRHGGRVWAEAEVDKGAAFFFTLQGS